jgi:hypothetical protein
MLVEQSEECFENNVHSTVVVDCKMEVNDMSKAVPSRAGTLI